MTNEELLSVAEIVERLVTRLHEQAANHEAKMVEHRAAFGVRTTADAKIIAGLRGERNWLRAEVAELKTQLERLTSWAAKNQAARETLQSEIDRLKSQTPKQHPVKVGEYVKRMTGFNTTLAGEIGRVTRVDDDAAEIEYEVKRQNGETGVWCAKNCEPCDPPTASHDTPAGKETAQAAAEPKPGDVGKGNGTACACTLCRRAEIERLKKPRQHPVKVGEWVRRTSFEHSIGTRIGAIAQVIDMDDDGDYEVAINGTKHCWSPKYCTPCDPPTEATHDTPEGRSVAESVIRDDRKTEPADAIKVGDVVEVFQSTASCTFKTDIGTRGTVLQLDDSCVDTAPLDGFLAPKCNHVALCDVRKVTT